MLTPGLEPRKKGRMVRSVDRPFAPCGFCDCAGGACIGCPWRPLHEGSHPGPLQKSNRPTSARHGSGSGQAPPRSGTHVQRLHARKHRPLTRGPSRERLWRMVEHQGGGRVALCVAGSVKPQRITHRSTTGSVGSPQTALQRAPARRVLRRPVKSRLSEKTTFRVPQQRFPYNPRSQLTHKRNLCSVTRSPKAVEI